MSTTVNVEVASKAYSYPHTDTVGIAVDTKICLGPISMNCDSTIRNDAQTSRDIVHELVQKTVDRTYTPLALENIHEIHYLLNDLVVNNQFDMINLLRQVQPLFDEFFEANQPPKARIINPESAYPTFGRYGPDYHLNGRWAEYAQ